MYMRKRCRIAVSSVRRCGCVLGFALGVAAVSCIGTAVAQRFPHQHQLPPVHHQLPHVPKQTQPPPHPPKHAGSSVQSKPLDSKPAPPSHQSKQAGSPSHTKEAHSPSHSKQAHTAAQGKQTAPAQQTKQTQPPQQTPPLRPTPPSHQTPPVEVVLPLSPPPPPPASTQTAPANNVTEAANSDLSPPMKVGAALPEREAGDKVQVKLLDSRVGPKKSNDWGSVRSFAAPIPPQTGTYNPKELLATNLPTAVADKLRKGGYEVKPSAASSLTRITLPPGLDAWTAQRQLEAEHQQGFALSIFYHPYSYALDSEPPISGAVPVGGSIGCDTARCYGRGLIAWEKDLGACAGGVTIGIIDTGYDESHPAFKNVNPKPTVIMQPPGGKASN